MYLRTIELRFKCKSAYCATAVKWLQGAQRECQSWDENHNIVPVIKQGKQARAHERAEFAPPSYPPPPTGLSNHISVAMCGGRETKISRTSLMHSYCMKYIKKAQTSTRVVGATGRRLSWKKRVYGFFPPLTTQRERRNKQKLVGVFFTATPSYHRTQPCKSYHVPSSVTSQGYHTTFCTPEAFLPLNEHFNILLDQLNPREILI